MRDDSFSNFGLIIAYLLPGFTALWGVGYFSETVLSWFVAPANDAPTVGGFLYATLASIAAGLTISTVRWMLVDSMHHWTGIRQPPWNFSRLQENLAAFDLLVAVHYRYYQFYANMLVALLFTYAAWRLSPTAMAFPTWTDLAFVATEVVFFAGSRDTLRKYHQRVSGLLSAEDGSGKALTPGRSSSRKPKA